MSSLIFNENLLHMNVLCVARYLDYTLAGIGNKLYIYSNEELLLSQPIFIGERLHSIYIKNNSIVLKGGRQLSLVKLIKSLDGLKCQIISKIQSADWVQDVIIFEDQLAGLVTSHNFFEYWNFQAKKRLNVCWCEEKCILYSCKIIGDTLENLVIFSGTVFGDVLMWAPFLEENPILKRFKAHNGAVFSIEVKLKDQLLTTTSDDRSLKIWSISPKAAFKGGDWKNSSIQLIQTLFGHTARVWKSLILADYFLTIGEDSQLIVWGGDCRIIKTFCLHQESGIRALHFSSETNVITTGGEDGGINAFSLDYLISQHKQHKILNLGQNGSTKVCFTKSGFVYILNGRCILATESGEEVVYENEDFSSYCLLEVSSEGEHIIMGSIKGCLVVIDSNTKGVIVEKQVLNGRIYSIHWLGRFLLTCGSEGRLDFWKLSSDGLKNVATKTLPNCKERWTTCGVVQDDKLMLGDRMGNLHIYELHGQTNPVKSYGKIHSYLGVTDVSVVNGVCRSIGRDGTIKEFTKDFVHSATCKLPMEWPWKIVEYKNDILILGFRGVSFIVWSVKQREVIASQECGGGHRSCDYKIQNNNLSFLYVKGKKVLVVNLILGGITRIRSGFHGKEINCLKILQTMPTVIVTGSEDTTLRISTVEESELRQVEVMKTHISSIRAVCTAPSETKLFIVSVGGKGQLVIWCFDLNALKCQELVNHRLRKETHSWKSSTPAVDPEIRIMCADMVKSKNEFILATGCSDCQIRIFSYSGGLNELCTVSYSNCVLNITLLEIDSMWVLVSMGTDGKVVFWETIGFSEIKHLEGYSLHQSGINSFHFEEIDTGKFILATGGDDNLISVAFVEIMKGKVNLRQLWNSSTTHSCQITGIAILKSFLITTSIDQRITMWNWSWHEDKFQIEFLNQHMISVPDVQGMDAVWLNRSAILVAIYGKGIEILQIEINSGKKVIDN